MFNRLLTVAVLAGFITGAAMTAVQMMWAVPLIHAAEIYEAAGEGPASHHGTAGRAHAHGHAHDHGEAPAAWGPADGMQRTFWTFVTNLSLAVGVSLVLSGLLTVRGHGNARTGLWWGVIGFTAFSAAPALGLPPELPGTAAAALEDRQLWWLLTVICTLSAIVLATRLHLWPAWSAAAGLAALPHVVGAPQPAMHAALAPGSLQQEFIAASLLSMLVFWLVVGAATGAIFARFHSTPADKGQVGADNKGAMSS